MNTFSINNITFNIIDDNSIELDRKSPILLHRFCYNNDIKSEIKKTKSILNDIESCLTICNKINKSYKKFKCLEMLTDISEDVKTKIYNTLDKNMTRNIIKIDDVYFLKRLLKTKTETLNKYETTNANCYNFIQERNIQRENTVKLKK